MRVKNVITIVIFISQIILTTGKRYGPYKTSLVSTGPCPRQKTTQPMDEEPPLTFIIEVYTANNYTLMRGNLTIFRDTSIKKMKLKRYAREGNNWMLKFQVTNNGCNPVFIPVFCAAANFNYDQKTCTFYKGVYTFKDIDINKLNHVHWSVMDYGRALWSVEVYSRVGTIFCQQMEIITDPDK